MTRKFFVPRPICILFEVVCPLATVIINANAAAPSSLDYLIRNLHEVQPSFASFDGEMYSGLLSTAPAVQGDEAERSSKERVDDGDEDGKLFFWLLEPRSPTNGDSLVLWLNGGPGCSSLAGMFFENGPVVLPSIPAGTQPPPDRFSSTHAPLLPNPYSWTNVTRMLYVEQPVGVGFSTMGSSTPPRDERDLSEDMYHFLQNFYDVFPHLKGKEFYIFGESYAGMYVPSIAHHIHERNSMTVAPASSSSRGKGRGEGESQPQRKRENINLVGVGIGNGWIDATIQGRSMIDYAYWHGLIDSLTRESLHATWEVCMGSIGAKTTGRVELQPPFHPFTTPDECGIMGSILAAAGAGAEAGAVKDAIKNGTSKLPGPSPYDVTTWDEYPALFDANGTISRFLDDDRVRDMLHVPRVGAGGDDNDDGGHGGAWNVCLPGGGRRRRLHRDGWNRVLQLLDHDTPISMTPYISSLLEEAKIRVLVYNGDRDLSCCVQGTEKALNAMEWTGRESWLDPSVARRGLWVVPGEARGAAAGGELEPAGYVKSHKNLTFLVVYNSGHLVPLNQPRHALDLIDRFLGNQTYSDMDLPAFGGGSFVDDTGSNIPEATRKRRPHYLRTLLLGFVTGFGVSFAFTKFREHPRYQRLDSGWL